MSKQLDLGAYLEKQSAAGTKDSEGRFTVAHDNAARKLAKFALPRRSAWVTKLIQAANAWEVPEVLIVQSRKETQFQLRFIDTTRLPTEEDVVNSMLNATPGLSGPVESFGAALRSLVEQARLSFVLVVDNGLDRPKPVYAGEYYGKISEAKRFSSRFRPQVGINLTVYHLGSDRAENILDFFNRPRSDKAIVLELETYCFVSKVPIFLDGKPLSGILNGRSTRPSPSLRPLLVGAMEDEEFTEARLDLPADFRVGALDLVDGTMITHPCLKNVADPVSAFTIMVAIPSGAQKGLSFPSERSNLLWCRQGVIVESQRLEVKTYGLGLSIYLSAHGLQTDLTGFQLAESEEKLLRVERACRACAKMLLELAPLVKPIPSSEYDMTPNPQEIELQNQKRVKTMAVGIVAGSLTSLANPVIGVPLIVGGLAKAWTVKPQVRNKDVLLHRRTLQETVTLDLKTLAKAIRKSGTSADSEAGQPGVEVERADSEYRDLARELADWKASQGPVKP